METKPMIDAPHDRSPLRPDEFAPLRTAPGWLHLRDVILLLVGRDFKGRYKHTRVGLAWSVISPLMYLLIFYFLFKKVIDLGVPHYASFVFIGILSWAWTQAALGQAVASIPANPGLVSQPGFPIAALPVVSTLSALINFLIALPLLLLLLWFEDVRFSPAMLFLPIVICVQFLVILSIAYIVAALNVGLRDIEYVLPIILQLGYYVTPVFFPLSRVPSQYLPLFKANPMARVIGAYRDVLMYGTPPHWKDLTAISVVSLLMIYVGRRYFEHARFRFLEEL